MPDERHKCADCNAMIRPEYPACLRCRAKRNAQDQCAWCTKPLDNVESTPKIQYCHNCIRLAEKADYARKAELVSFPEHEFIERIAGTGEPIPDGFQYPRRRK